jgi:plasmid replication initiation protein
MAKPVKPQLPDRHPQTDFFVCDVLDAVPKDDMASMEHPIYSLSTKPDTRIVRYEHNGNTIDITPSVKGLATIHDKDILIYCVSQLIAKMNRGEPVSRTIRLKAYDLLVSTNRETSGDAYKRLRESFERLKGTVITTDITTNGQRTQSGFGIIENWEIKDNGASQRMAEVEIVLSKWAYNAVLGKEVLTLPRDYFRLRKPLERRIYELARKHCGQQNEWSISLDLLRKKCGSSSNEREFRRMVSTICEENSEHNHIPDYVITLEGDNVGFINRNNMPKSVPSLKESDYPHLSGETFNEARIVAPTYDVYYLQQEWRDFWVDSGKPELKNPDAAFIGFCKKRYERKPHP